MSGENGMLFDVGKVEKKKYPLEPLKPYAKGVFHALQPYFGKLRLCGSARRLCEEIRDLDFVGSQSIDQYQQLVGSLRKSNMKLIQPRGKIISFMMPVKIVTALSPCLSRGERGKIEEFDFPVEIYLADEGNWWATVIQRTGSKENNIRLCREAQRHGMSIDFAYGCVRKNDQVVGDIDSEESLWRLLGLDYQKPEER